MDRCAFLVQRRCTANIKNDAQFIVNINWFASQYVNMELCTAGPLKTDLAVFFIVVLKKKM